MSELASVGADIVLLLVRVIQVSNSDRMDKELSETATFMLNTLYRVLSKCVLPRILGIFLLFLKQSVIYRCECRSCLSVHKPGHLHCGAFCDYCNLLWVIRVTL